MSDAAFDVNAKIGKPWKKPPFVQRPWLRYLLMAGFVAYLIAAFMTIEVNWSRVYEGLERGKQFVLAFTSPDFTSRSGDIYEGMMESIIMTAIKASGARWTQWINYGVQPQVMPRLIGLSMYRLDINFRESAILGLVGAGGIGATLNTAFDRYEYDTAAAILLIIIVIVMALEYLSGIIRARVQ